MLRRYWITFSPAGIASPLNLGCGITAKSRREAEDMAASMVFPIFGEREIVNMLEDIDVSSLDPDHILPNIGDPASIGVWFPPI